MNEIPWTQIGAFGSFALIVLFIALYFLTKWRKGRNTPGTINRSRCINDPRFQTGLTDIAMTKEAMSEMKGDMKTLREKAVEQTNVLKNIYDEAKDQSRHLEKICNKIGRK